MLTLGISSFCSTLHLSNAVSLRPPSDSLNIALGHQCILTVRSTQNHALYLVDMKIGSVVYLAH
jgi:hypothetical protein